MADSADPPPRHKTPRTDAEFLRNASWPVRYRRCRASSFIRNSHQKQSRSVCLYRRCSSSGPMIRNMRFGPPAGASCGPASLGNMNLPPEQPHLISGVPTARVCRLTVRARGLLVQEPVNLEVTLSAKVHFSVCDGRNHKFYGEISSVSVQRCLRAGV